ncbi:MAG: serine/threonine protein phosphatase [Eubacterium sp.]
MSIFKRRAKTESNEVKSMPTMSVQTTNMLSHPFKSLNTYTPLVSVNNRVFRSIREGVPIIDSAIHKIVRLMGGFRLVTGDERIDLEMNRFLEGINVGGNQRGIQAFIDNFIVQLLTYGTAVGEIVQDEECIYALFNGELDAIDVRRAPNGVDIEFFNHSDMSVNRIEHQDRILFSVLNPEAGSILGTSLLSGLPFVADILLKIYNTIGTNWERVGNLRYAVTYKPQNDSSDKAFAKERANQMASAWKDAMSSKSSVKDFVAVGDVKVSVIGADNQVLDSEIPVRQMLEQIIAKTGLMPYMFGLSWSTTERMSQQQADVLTTELWAYRRIITPVIAKIGRAYLATLGTYCDVDVEWEEITLQDETQAAQARLYNAQADQLLREAGEC